MYFKCAELVVGCCLDPKAPLQGFTPRNMVIQLAQQGAIHLITRDMQNKLNTLVKNKETNQDRANTLINSTKSLLQEGFTASNFWD